MFLAWTDVVVEKMGDSPCIWNRSCNKANGNCLWIRCDDTRKREETCIEPLEPTVLFAGVKKEQVGREVKRPFLRRIKFETSMDLCIWDWGKSGWEL